MTESGSATTPLVGAELSMDQQAALHSVSLRLVKEFAGVFTAQVIDRLLISSYDDLAANARIPTYLPLLAERFARERLRALAKVEGHPGTGLPAILFLCTHNTGRSQMALGFFTALAGERASTWSSGTQPGEFVDPTVVQAMAEVGIDITDEYPKPWTDEILSAADVVISMGCGDSCPTIPGRRYEEWDLPDPAGQDLDTVRRIRDDIKTRVGALVADRSLTSTP